MVQKRVILHQEVYFLSLMIVLSLITLLFSFFSSFSNYRTYTIFIKYLFVNSLLFLSLSWLFEITKNSKRFKITLILASVIYSFFYIVSSIAFITTGQITRIQTIFFIIKVNPLYLSLIVPPLLIFLFLFLSLIIDKRILFSYKNKRIFNKKLFLIFLVFLFFVGFNLFYPELKIEEELLADYPSDRGFLLFSNQTEGTPLILSNKNETKLNVIFILLESVNSDRLSSYGYEKNVTPNIDFIVENGLMFENAYTVATHSDYAQPAYLSSNHVLKNNIRNLFKEQENQNAVWQIFKREGYKTYYFSSQDDNWAGMNNYFNYSSLDYYWYSETDGLKDYGWGVGKKDYDHKTIEKAIVILNETRFKGNCYELQNNSNVLLKKDFLPASSCSSNPVDPFFLYLNFQATHDPLVFPPEYSHFVPDKISPIDSEEENIVAKVNRYDNALRYIDFQVGTLLDYLRETNQLNDTLIILSSDHGHDLYSRHNSYGHGLSIYEDEIKVPLAFLIPGEEPRVIRERVSHIDVLPSVIKLMVFNFPIGLRGRPFESNRRIFFYAQNHMYLIGMIEGDLKIILDINRNLAEVYNLTKDPLEQYNLIKTGDYLPQIRLLLTWHHCQLNYFSKDEPEYGLEKYCEIFRN